MVAVVPRAPHRRRRRRRRSQQRGCRHKADETRRDRNSGDRGDLDFGRFAKRGGDGRAKIFRRLAQACCGGRTRRRQDIQSIGADASRRSPKDIATIYGDSPQPSANDVRSIGADIARQLSQKYRDERRQPATIARSDVAATLQPVEAQLAGEATEHSPQRNDCYTYPRTVASALRESITMVARYHHLAIWFAQFGHDLTLTSQRAMRRWENAERDRSRENLGRKSWGAKSWGRMYA